MKLNKFIWNNYKQSEQGSKTIDLFEKGNTDKILGEFLGTLDVNPEYVPTWVSNFIENVTFPTISQDLSAEEAEFFFYDIVEKGIVLTYEDGEIENIGHESPDLILDLISIISMWLFTKYPDYFKPYFFKSRFKLLTKIADTFNIELPEVPLKRY